MRAKVGTE